MRVATSQPDPQPTKAISLATPQETAAIQQYLVLLLTAVPTFDQAMTVATPPMRTAPGEVQGRRLAQRQLVRCKAHPTGFSTHQLLYANDTTSLVPKPKRVV